MEPLAILIRLNLSLTTNVYVPQVKQKEVFYLRLTHYTVYHINSLSYVCYVLVCLYEILYDF